MLRRWVKWVYGQVQEYRDRNNTRLKIADTISWDELRVMLDER